MRYSVPNKNDDDDDDDYDDDDDNNNNNNNHELNGVGSFFEKHIVAQLTKNPSPCKEPKSSSLGLEDPPLGRALN
jgi:hypothetical protein